MIVKSLGERYPPVVPLYYKDEPYTPYTLHQRLIVTYSPKYAGYQKTIRDAQVERAERMPEFRDVKKAGFMRPVRFF